MLRAFGIVALLAVCGLLACSGSGLAGGSSETGNAGLGYVRVEACDAPPSTGVEHVYLHVAGMDLHGESGGWQVLSRRDTMVDFAQLLNGATAQLADSVVPVDSYDELRVLLGDSSRVVVSGQTWPLTIPSGAQSGVKVELAFAVAEAETVDVYLDLDLAEAVNWTGAGYSLTPAFEAFRRDVTGSISGVVRSDSGPAVVGALVQALGATDTLSTLTAPGGAFRLRLPSGTYDVRCAADGFTVADTLYAGVSIAAGGNVAQLNFVLR
jgi:hypothetical protein